MATEAAYVVEYLHRHSMDGDGLAIDGGPPRRLAVAATDLSEQAAVPTVRREAPAAVLAAIRPALAMLPDDHHSTVLITSDEERWIPAYQPATTSVRSDAAAARQSFLIVLTPSMGSSPRLHDATQPLPARIWVDPEVPGDLAAALARAWVQSYGGGWTPHPLHEARHDRHAIEEVLT